MGGRGAAGQHAGVGRAKLRQIVGRVGTAEDVLVYRRQGLSGREAAVGAPVVTSAVAPASGGFRPVTPQDQAFVIPAGTHLPLE
jgi:predicted butyrate kinase (DUF1464 family)